MSVHGCAATVCSTPEFEVRQGCNPHKPIPKEKNTADQHYHSDKKKPLHAVAAFSVLLIHSETVILLAFAADSTALMASGENRTGTMRPFAFPFGSFGRPIFGLVALAMFAELLNDCSLYGGLWRDDWRDVQDGHMPLGVLGIVRVVNPSIDSIRLWVPLQPKDFHDAIPNRQPSVEI